MAGYERVEWVVLEHKTTGETLIVNVFEKRLSKMRKRFRAWAECVEMWSEGHDVRMVMVTLTYENVGDYGPGDVRNYLNRVRGMLKEDLLAWSWVAELQKRGAMHYHVVMLVKKGTNLPKPDEHGHWEKGMSRVQTIRSPYYLVRYTGKERQKDLSRFPKGARLYGSSIRFGGKEMRLIYRYKAGLLNWEGAGESAYRFKGAAVTEGYAKRVLGGIMDEG